MQMKLDCGGGNAFIVYEENHFKQSKDRVTLLACANASGICKLPSTNTKKPRCFNHMDVNGLPFDCHCV